MYRNSSNTGLLIKSVVAVLVIVAVGIFLFHSHAVQEKMRSDLQDAQETAKAWEQHFHALDDYNKAQLSYEESVKDWLAHLRDQDQVRQESASIFWVVPLCAANPALNHPKPNPNVVRLLPNAPDNPSQEQNHLFDQFGKEK